MLGRGAMEPPAAWLGRGGGGGGPLGRLASALGMRPPHSTQNAAPSNPSAPQWGHRADRPAMVVTVVPTTNTRGHGDQSVRKVTTTAAPHASTRAQASWPSAEVRALAVDSAERTAASMPEP